MNVHTPHLVPTRQSVGSHGRENLKKGISTFLGILSFFFAVASVGDYTTSNGMVVSLVLAAASAFGAWWFGRKS